MIDGLITTGAFMAFGIAYVYFHNNYALYYQTGFSAKILYPFPPTGTGSPFDARTPKINPEYAHLTFREFRCRHGSPWWWGMFFPYTIGALFVAWTIGAICWSVYLIGKLRTFRPYLCLP